MHRTAAILTGLSLFLGACDSRSAAPAPQSAPLPSTGPLESERKTVTRGTGANTGIDVVNRLPFALVRGNTGDIEVLSEGGGGKNWVVTGSARVPVSKLADRGVARNMRVEDIQVTADVCIVVVDVSYQAGKNPFFAIIDPARREAPTLVDTQGDRYLPVGFAYKDTQWAQVRYEPGKPVENVSEMTSLSRTRNDQQMWLIYRVSFGRSVKYIARGNQAVFELDPMVNLTTPQAR